MAEKPSTIITFTVEGEDYDLDCSEFTARECGILKRVGHIRGVMDIPSALDVLDLEAIVAMAVIAMKRVGVNANAEKLLDAESGDISIKLPDSEEPDGKEDPTKAGEKTTPGDTGTPS